MKKTWIIRALLLIAYCVPFAFLSVNGDATSGTMLFYGVMIAGFALLCWGAYLNVAALPCSLILTPPDDEQSPGIFHLQEDFE